MLTSPSTSASRLALPSDSWVHPSDGPDLDVRARIDGDGVHLTITVNLAFIDENTEFARELVDELHEVELEPLGEDLLDYFSRAVTIEVDGQAIAPSLGDPVRQLRGPKEMVPYNPVYGIRALTLVKLELDYPRPEATGGAGATDDAGPRSVLFDWHLFADDLAQPIDPPPPMTVRLQLNDGSGDLPLELTVDEPQYTWHGEVMTFEERLLPVVEPPAPKVVEVPVASAGLLLLALVLLASLPMFTARRSLRVGIALVALGLGGALWGTARIEFETADGSLLTTAAAVDAFERLHQNLYTAFDFDDREVVYDALAKSVGGDHLDRTYSRVFRSLILENDGGAVTRVKAVRHLDTELESQGFLEEYACQGFTVRSRWQVDGSVTHSNHTHERTQEYSARFAVGETADGWRILGDEISEEFVVSAKQIDLRNPLKPPVDSTPPKRPEGGP
jgi:hypothetical protein